MVHAKICVCMFVVLWLSRFGVNRQDSLTDAWIAFLVAGILFIHLSTVIILESFHGGCS